MENLETKFKDMLGKKLQTGVLLSKYSNIGVGGVADFFYQADTVEDLIEAVGVSHKLNIPYFILGGGYNVVISDFGYSGLVIKNNASNVVINKQTGEVIADSGLSIGKFITLAISNDLGGMEFLAGIPGTLGGAVYNNAGAARNNISDIVKSITLLEERNGELKIVRHNSEWMRFAYRSSHLKSDFGGKKFKPVILSVKLQLSQKRRDEILKIVHDNIDRKKQAQPLSEKSAGSYFKNPGKTKEESAGYLLEQSGAKKMRVGGAGVSKMHANFIINRKGANARDIRRLAEDLRRAVKENYDITLEEEIEYIGKW